MDVCHSDRTRSGSCPWLAAQRRTIAALAGTAVDSRRGEAAPAPRRRRLCARNTAIFSIATGISRVAGMLREIVAAGYFGTSGPASAFTIAFKVPNLVQQPVRERRAVGGVRARLHRPAAAGKQARGDPARLDAVLDHADRPRRDHRRGDARGRAVHAAVHRRDVQLPARRADRRALADPLPGRPAARPDGPASSGSFSPTTTSRSRRSRRPSGTS